MDVIPGSGGGMQHQMKVSGSRPSSRGDGSPHEHSLPCRVVTTFRQFMVPYCSFHRIVFASKCDKLFFIASQYAYFQRHFMVLVTTCFVNSSLPSYLE